MTRRMFLGTLGAAPLATAAFWDKREFPHWSQKVVDRMLTDSPWAKSTDVQIELHPRRQSPLASSFGDIGWPGGNGWPGGGSRVPTSSPAPGPGQGGNVPGTVTRGEAYLTVRWSSALPIRQAMLLDRHGRLRDAPDEEVQALKEEPKDYVIEIFGIPAQVLQTSRKAMEANLLRSSQLSIAGRQPIRATEATSPPQGEYRFLTLRFPKTDPIALDDKEVKLFASAG
ncbi:MAG: hypothetical protein GY953_12665, partial [bacterium]|nr:hypothetical protein [bacterium]